MAQGIIPCQPLSAAVAAGRGSLAASAELSDAVWAIPLFNHPPLHRAELCGPHCNLPRHKSARHGGGQTCWTRTQCWEGHRAQRGITSRQDGEELAALLALPHLRVGSDPRSHRGGT